jgi:ribonuclease HI
MKNVITIYTDGASRGNPGPAAAAFIFLDGKDKLYENGSFLGTTTNNAAEYQAILSALKEVQQFTNNSIQLYSDSQLVIRQLNNVYNVKSKRLLPYYKKIQKVKEDFKQVSFRHVSRTNKYIKKCDALANEILDQHSH